MSSAKSHPGGSVRLRMAAMTAHSRAEHEAHGPTSGAREPRRRVGDVEWPTLALAIGIYGAWFALTYFHEAVPDWLLAVAGGFLVAWHGSLQHEAVHGHPARNALVNTLIAGWPLNLYLPYELYRESHLLHHRTGDLTHPIDDPESYYVLDRDWNRFDRVRRRFLQANQTLLGRMLIGPVVAAVGTIAGGVRDLIARRDRRKLRIWGTHAALVALIVFWLEQVCGLAVWKYVLMFAYPGIAFTLLRSFYEHRPHEKHVGRTAIVEDKLGLLGLLFLHNNLHAVHHAHPAVPWYALPRLYRADLEAWRARSNGHFFRGYGEIARCYLLTPKDSPVHPYAASPLARQLDR